MRKDSTKRERWVAVVKDSHWGFITIQERARGLGKKKKKKRWRGITNCSKKNPSKFMFVSRQNVSAMRRPQGKKVYEQI